MEITPTPLPGLVILKPRRFGDARGWFTETWNAEVHAQAGLAEIWKQDNHSYSAAKGTLRGLHYQSPPRAQAKLVRCGAGAVWDVAVDMRPGSATRGQHFGLELSRDNGLQLLIPAGFLHGFVTLTDAAELIYKCTDTYSPAHDGAVAWDDPTLAIPWPLTAPPTLSDKDRAAPRLTDWTNPF